MAETDVRRPHFEPDGSSVAATAVQDTASPIASSTALARFEFESGRGNEGTKILMVEWEDDDHTKNTRGDWHVSWQGKSTVLPAKDQIEGRTHRLYFLLPPGVHVPPHVNLVHQPADGGKATEMQVNPLPAIFPPELGASARTAGKKGVLHTIWAKKRLSVLQKEIEAECLKNAEGVGLEMVLQEKDWIEHNFGVGARPTSLSMPASGEVGLPLSPTSPRSPGGGRLAEKLKGLRVGTTEKELNARPRRKSLSPPLHSTIFCGANYPVEPSNDISVPSQDSATGSQYSKDAHPLSPETADVAISSFAAFHGNTPRPNAPSVPRMVPQAPPPSVLQQQAATKGAMSLNSLDQAVFDKPSSTSQPILVADEEEQEDGLFAVKMSPRSPDMTKSPFSFAAKDTAPWMKQATAGAKAE
jgi:hypothetical protein